MDDHRQGMSDDTRRELAEVMAAMKAIREGGTAAKPDPLDTATAKLPGKGEWTKAAPAVAMVCGTLLIVSFVVVFAALALTGTPTDPFFRLINLFLNALGAIATLATLAVAMMHARRTLVNRAITTRAATDAGKAATEAHDAAEHAARTAVEVNGKLTVRIVKALAPVIERAVDQAVERALNQRCPGADDHVSAEE